MNIEQRKVHKTNGNPTDPLKPEMAELTQEQMEAVSGGVDLRDNNKCPYCIGCWFRTRADLNKHMEQSHYVQCVFCQSYFPSRDELDKHVQEFHS